MCTRRPWMTHGDFIACSRLNSQRKCCTVLLQPMAVAVVTSTSLTNVTTSSVICILVAYRSQNSFRAVAGTIRLKACNSTRQRSAWRNLPRSSATGIRKHLSEVVRGKRRTASGWCGSRLDLQTSTDFSAVQPQSRGNRHSNCSLSVRGAHVNQSVQHTFTTTQEVKPAPKLVRMTDEFVNELNDPAVLEEFLHGTLGFCQPTTPRSPKRQLSESAQKGREDVKERAHQVILNAPAVEVSNAADQFMGDELVLEQAILTEASVMLSTYVLQKPADAKSNPCYVDYDEHAGELGRMSSGEFHDGFNDPSLWGNANGTLGFCQLAAPRSPKRQLSESAQKGREDVEERPHQVILNAPPVEVSNAIDQFMGDELEPESAQLAKSTENDNDSDDVVMQELLAGSWDLVLLVKRRRLQVPHKASAADLQVDSST